ncbi:MAG: hypothetical protein PHO66_04740 [Eubacteriales bacterium]|nr:hypothetical protein [Eubacteriales bacterium]
MSIYELDTLTLAYARLEDTPENRAALSALFLQAYNEAYAAIVQEKIQPVRREALTLDDDAAFACAALAYPVQRILQVEDAAGRALERQMDEYGVCHVPGYAGRQVWVHYRYLPRPLGADDADGPVLLNAANHGALSLFAAARYHATEMQLARSEFFMQKDYEAVAGIRRVEDGARTRFAAHYPPAPR